MSKYSEILGYASPTTRGAVRAKDVVAALAPPPRSSLSLVKSDAAAQTSATEHVKAWIPGLAGGAVGAYMWKRHRVLGFLAGHAVGSNATKLYKGDRKSALCDLAVEGAAILGALNYKKLPLIKHLSKTVGPVAGFAGGLAAGLVATSFVDGSPASELKAKLKKG